MGDVARQAANMIDMLPAAEQMLALEVIKKIVLAWDPDFAKLTPGEEQELMEAIEDDHFPLDLDGV